MRESLITRDRVSEVPPTLYSRTRDCTDMALCCTYRAGGRVSKPLQTLSKMSKDNFFPSNLSFLDDDREGKKSEKGADGGVRKNLGPELSEP